MLGTTFIPSDLSVVDAQPDAQWSASLETLAPGVTSLVEAQRTLNESWVDSLARLLPSIAATYQQKQLLDVQVERARMGLAPLDVSQYAPGVKVGVSPELQNLMMWGGIALLGVLAFSAMRGR